MKNGVFVITNDPDRADSLALDEPTKAAGQEGAIVVKADAEPIAVKILEQLGDQIPVPDQLRPALAAPLDLLTGSLKADTSGVSGTIRLTLRQVGARDTKKPRPRPASRRRRGGGG